MPQVAAWTNVIERDLTKKCTADAGSPTFSFVAVDRSGIDHLISGEFCADKTAAGDINKSGRVARWPLDGDTGQPKLSNGLWKADAAYRLPISNIQGAVSYNNKWYLSRSQGSSNGFLYVTKPITSSTGILEIETGHFAAVGPEDLSHWTKSDGSAGSLWTVTEHAGKRLLPTNTDNSAAETAHKPITTTTNTFGSGVGAGGSDGGNASGASPALNADIKNKSST
ncbi:unnamed protein product [Rotaria sp. Silwood1]|nr:unnamed protein product [Rotaria sp. Silwood1]